MVECELHPIATMCRWLRVLIDTWWNVNVCKAAAIRSLYSVLIDTWWNVNRIRMLGGAL